jgi:hypothetical protein
VSNSPHEAGSLPHWITSPALSAAYPRIADLLARDWNIFA